MPATKKKPYGSLVQHMIKTETESMKPGDRVKTRTAIKIR